MAASLRDDNDELNFLLGGMHDFISFDFLSTLINLI